MKAKALLLITISAIIHSGCGVHREHSQADTESTGPAHNEHTHDAVAHGVEFKEGKGLTVPTLTGERLGLKIVDAEEGKATRRIDLGLRVFNVEKVSDANFAYASGSVTTNTLAFLKAGTEVVLDNGGDGLVGQIFKLEPDTAKLTGLAEVIVRIPASKNVQVGTFLDGHVTVETEEGVVVIPKQAVLKTAEGHFAYVVNGDSLFRTKIEVGGQDGETVEVQDGLYAGDQVVIQPVMPLWMAELQAIRGGKACADGH